MGHRGYRWPQIKHSPGRATARSLTLASPSAEGQHHQNLPRLGPHRLHLRCHPEDHRRLPRHQGCICVGRPALVEMSSGRATVSATTAVLARSTTSATLGPTATTVAYASSIHHHLCRRPRHRFDRFRFPRPRRLLGCTCAATRAGMPSGRATVSATTAVLARSSLGATLAPTARTAAFAPSFRHLQCRRPRCHLLRGCTHAPTRARPPSSTTVPATTVALGLCTRTATSAPTAQTAAPAPSFRPHCHHSHPHHPRHQCHPRPSPHRPHRCRQRHPHLW
jgi:hypothetical protein